MTLDAYWTDDRIAMLREHWLAGSSASQVAQLLGGCSRSAVLGKARRLGLLKARGSRVAALQRGVAVRANRKREDKREHILRRRSPTQERTDAWAALPGTTPVDLIDLDRGMCKWPIGRSAPFLFCGTEASGIYCEHHQALSQRGKVQ